MLIFLLANDIEKTTFGKQICQSKVILSLL